MYHYFAIISSKVQQVVAGSFGYERKVRAACEAGLHLTDGQSNLRASATESRPLHLQGSDPQTIHGFATNHLRSDPYGVRVKGWGKSPPVGAVMSPAR